ncbi:hypothetical protein [Gordonia neofelifaecis]|uniref:Integral membrane protein n=1 Tax=Gordonia neofelifaecis NRRL B-59395 TaxID=644548 RepID=F1YMJ7_9ACTN|nr:hypothetical protein [Gordonia neofelifaecis]EGD54122.1 hypothetical protein SCNU_15409 [Gordonia neofelifaecis NRRL B-59395]
MTIGLLAAVVAALAFGTASVLQAHAASSTDTALSAMLRPLFLTGMALDGIGFVATAVASRNIPLFLSQPIISANLVVTAVLAAAILKVSLTRRDIAGIAVVMLSLLTLGLTAGAEGHDDPGAALHWGLLAIGLVLLACGLVGVVIRPGEGARWLALTAAMSSGVLFGLMAVGVRIVDGITPFDLPALLTDPAAYAVLVCGPGGFYLFTVALQAGSVASAAAALAVGETVVPGIVGAALLGDTTQPGWGAVTVVAFAAAVAGAVTVAMSDGVRAAT